LSKKIRDWLPEGVSEFSGKPEHILNQPLVNQPGEKWAYGVNIDWVGELVSRVSGLTLNDYLIKHVLEPIGAKDINMFPTDDMKSRLATIHKRAPDGTLKVREGPHLMNAPLDAKTPEEIKATVNSGGGGCFGVPSEYCSRFINMIISRILC
jgi:CubicO group peptidase (beta-lactamase class C family)